MCVIRYQQGIQDKQWASDETSDAQGDMAIDKVDDEHQWKYSMS